MTLHPTIPLALHRRLKERLKHNEAYLLQSVLCRRNLTRLTYGAPKSLDWLAGEQAAIEAENEWIRALLAGFPSTAKVTVQPDAHGKREVRKGGEVIGRQG